MVLRDAARLAALGDDDSSQDPLSRARELCGLCQAVTGVSGVALSIAGGAPQYVSSTVCATDAVSMRLEDLQHTLGEGPRVDALDCLRPVLVADLVEPVPGRWSWFAPAAVDAGASALFVYPVSAGRTCLGALSLYRSASGDLTVQQLDDLAAAADAAAVMLLSAYVDAGEECDSWALGEGTGFQPQVPQAVGVLMADLNADADEAMARLRAHAFAAGQSLGQAARDIVSGRLVLDDGAA